MSLNNYIKGFRKGKEAHRLEKEAMNDPFLADALDGYDQVKDDHMARIVEMQKRILIRTKRKSYGLWISSVCSAAVILIAVYFAVFDDSFNKPSFDDETLYVYIPQSYVDKKKFEFAEYEDNGIAPVTPVADIRNIEILAPDERLDIYVPEEYVERRRLEISTDSEEKSRRVQVTTEITNLNDIFIPDQAIIIYIPEGYSSRQRH